MSEAVRSPVATATPAAPAAAPPVAAERDAASAVRDAVGNRGFGRLLQAKLTVGAPSDPFEREADAVAERVTEPSDEQIRTHTVAAPIIQRKPADDEQDEEDEENEPGLIQSKRDSAGPPTPAPRGISAGLATLRGSGDPLTPSTRGYFEPRFGRDLASVRTHTGSVADGMSRSIGAQAFTFGSNIAFRSGTFSPQTKEGRRLLAHELTHVVQQTGAPPKAIPPSFLSQPSEDGEREARTLSAGVLRGQVAPSRSSKASEFLPHGLPPEIDRERSAGRPLADAADLERRFGSPLSHVRVHDDAAAAALADAADARAFTAGSHIFFNRGEYRPSTAAGRALLAHELAHVAGGHSTRPRLWRNPKGVKIETPFEEIQVNPPGSEPSEVEEWERLQIHASGMDAAALGLADHQALFTNNGKTRVVFIGLHPSFLKVYDQDGRPLGRKIPMKPVKGLTFHPGVYATGPKGDFIAMTVSTKDRVSFEPGPSFVGSRSLTKDELAAIAEEEKKAEEQKRSPKPRPVTNLEELVTDPAAVRALAGDAYQIYFVPTYPPPPKPLYSSPLQGRGDGQPANAPPWPVSVEGPKLVPHDSTPTYSATVDWSANGNWNIPSMVISQVGERIHYRWERFDITEYAKQEIKKDAASTKQDPARKPEKSLDQRVDEFKSSSEGTGEDVTGTGGAKREFKREFEDWWKDNKGAAKRSVNPEGDTVAERLSNRAANRLALELAPVSLLTTSVGATVKLIADLFAGPRQQQEVPMEKEGFFLIRVISTPGINEDTKGTPIIRPPSVAARITEVTTLERSVSEALDEPEAQLAELQAQIDLAEKGGNKDKAEYLRSLLEKARFQFESTPLDLLLKKRKEKWDDLVEFRKKFGHVLSDYSRAREVEMLDDQIALYRFHEKKRTKGAISSLPAMKRLNATLISEVTGEQYPLLLAAGPMEMDGSQYQWLISDVTNREGDPYIGLGTSKRAAFQSALDKFGKKAAYGRGRIGVHTAGLGLEDDTPKELSAVSAPADWALAEKRLDDLVTTLAVLGLFVASMGTVGAVVGAAVAAARLIQRWQAGKLYLDAQTVSDALSVLGGFGAAGQVLAGLRLQKFEKAFVLLQEGRATETQIAKAAEILQAAENAQKLLKVVEAANEVLNYGGLIWGNVTFIDQMLAISAQEQSGAITHAAARRARAQAISSAVQNNGMFIAGNVMKAREQKKAAERRDAPEKAPAEKVPAEKVPPGEGGAGEQAIPEELNHPAQKAGDPVPVAERRATLGEMQAVLPSDLRKLVVIDESLVGDHVQVDFVLDKTTGLITEITIRCGPDARLRTVQLHTETARTMQKYQGFSGRVQQAINWVRELVGLEVISPDKNLAEFKAVEEVKKLPKLIDEQMRRMQDKTEPNARAEAEAELASLEAQLEQHMQTLELGTGVDVAPGEAADFVAAKGLSKEKKKKYAALMSELRNHKPGSDKHREIRWEMYDLIGGTLKPEVWDKVYDANMGKAKKASEAVLAEQKRLGWTTPPEVTVDVSKTEVRRLDLAEGKKGCEVKAYETGYITASEDIVWEVERDAKLVKNKHWDITWILVDTEPSAPLLDMLLKAGITVELRTRKGGGDSVLLRPPYVPASKVPAKSGTK